MPRFTLPNDRWIDLELGSVNDLLEVIDLPEAEGATALIERMRFYRDLFRKKATATSWNGDAGEMTATEMSGLVSKWLNATEEDAVPLAPESDSDTPSPEPPSEAPTAKPRRSASRRS